MSRIGKKPIEIPSGVEATLRDGTIEVKGALGSRHFDFSEKLDVNVGDKRITVTPKNSEKDLIYTSPQTIKIRRISI